MKLNIEIEDYKIEKPFLKFLLDISRLINVKETYVETGSEETKSKIAKMIDEIKKRKAKTQAQEEILNFISAEEYEEPKQVFDDKQNLIGWKVERKEKTTIPLISEEDVKKE